MKNLYYYLLWEWNRVDKHFLSFIVFMTTLAAGLVFAADGHKTIGGWLLILGVVGHLALLFKIFVIDSIRKNYKKYKLEQADTFKQLKRDY